MKIIQIVPPQRGSVERIALDEKSVLSLTFDLASVETLKEGNDLLFIFSDGSIVLLENYFQAEVSPVFLLANGEVLQTFEEMLAFSAKAETVLQEVALAENEGSDISALSVNVAAGGMQNGSSGIGEFRDSDGLISSAIDRLPLGNEGQIGTGNGIGGNTAPGVDVPPTGGIGTEVPAVPPTTIQPDPVPGWSDSGVTGGMVDPIEMFPGISVGLPDGIVAKGVVITLKNFCFTGGGDKIFLGGKELDMTKDPVVDIDGNPLPGFTIKYVGGELTITKTDGSSLEAKELNDLLNSFKFQNSGIGSNSSFDTGYRDVDIVITDGDGNTIVPEGNDGKDFINADLNFREYQQVSGEVTVKAGDSDIFVNGSSKNDTITVTESTAGGKHHLIVGGDGNDSIQGAMGDHNLILGDGSWDKNNSGCTVDPSKGTGNDNLTGGNVSDVIIGGAGIDTIDGGAGNDILVGGALAKEELTTLQGILAGMDSITPEGLQELLQALQGITKDTEADTIHGGAGNDLIIGGGSDSIDGGAGNDLIYVSDGSNTIDGGDGNDTIFGGAGNDSINGGDGNDTIFGGAGNDSIDGGAGDDSISTGGGTNTITNNPYEGNDTFVLNDDVNTTIKGGLDGDTVLTTGTVGDTITIEGNVSNSTITLGAGKDNVTITGDIFGDTKIDLGAGNDSIGIEGSMSGGTIDAGEGNDALTVSSTISGGTINAGAGNDTLTVGKDITGNATIILGSESEDEKDILDVQGNIFGGNVSMGGGDDSVTIAGFVTGGKIDLGTGKDTITIVGAIGGNGTIDAGDGENSVSVGGAMSGGNITTGKDSDTIAIAGGMNNGSIDAGDGADSIDIGNHNTDKPGGGTSTVPAMSGGTVNGGAGNDIITIHGNMTGGTIDGGIGDDSITIHGDMEGGKIDLSDGKDTLVITGTVVGGEIIFGDADNNLQLDNGITGDVTIDMGKGNDTIVLGTCKNDTVSPPPAGTPIANIMTDGTILLGDGDDQALLHGNMIGGTIDGGIGNDIVYIHGNVSGNASINLGAGADTVALAGGIKGDATVIFGAEDEDEDDTLWVHGSIAGGTVRMGGGDDIVVIKGDMTNGTVSLGTGNNTLSIDGTMNNGTITAGDGKDSITIGTMSGGSIFAGDGNDSITITNMSGNATVDAGNGEDRIVVTTMNGGSIFAGDGNDVITITNMSGNATVDAGNGEDRIVVTTMNGGSIFAGEANDQVNIESLVSGNINLGAGNDTINVASMSDGAHVDADAGNDSIDIGTMSGGTINSGTGNDTIHIGSMTGGTIDAGIGDDKITITSTDGNYFNAGSIINGGEGTDTLVLNTTGGGLTGDLTLDKMPQLNGIECIDVGGSKLVFGDSNLENVLAGNNNTVTFLITDWSKVNFEPGSGWTQVVAEDGTISYKNGDYTIHFEGKDGATINGTPPKPGEITSTAEEAVMELLTPLLTDDKHSAEQRSATESAIATVVALAMAGATELHAGEAFTLGEEEKTIDTTPVADSFSSVLAMEQEQHIDTTSLQNSTPLEVVANPIQYSIPESEDILAVLEEQKEDLGIVTEQSASENPVETDVNSTAEVVDNSAVIESIPVQHIEGEVLAVEEAVEEVVAENVENIPVHLEDLITEENEDLPREEVESLEGIYGTAEVNDWYTMNTFAVSPEIRNNAIDSSENGIQIANATHTDAVEINSCFAAFEFIEPSTELQYDEQIF